MRKFRTEGRAVEWLMDPEGSGYAWAGGADGSLPVQQQNWHQRLRAVYEIKPGYTPPAKAVREYVARWSGSSRRVTVETAKASLYREHSTRRVMLTDAQVEQAKALASAPPTITYEVVTHNGAGGYGGLNETPEDALDYARTLAASPHRTPGTVFEVQKVETFPNGARRYYLRDHGEWSAQGAPRRDAAEREPDYAITVPILGAVE